MKVNLLVATLAVLVGIGNSCCTPDARTKIIESIGSEEYSRLMELPLDEFDQSSEGFRQYSGNYDLVCLIIPEYIRVNDLSPAYARNLRWHLGQIHAFNERYEAAIVEMEQSYEGGSVSWASYVAGTIAFLNKDKAALQDALTTLSQQENQMNIEILEKLVRHFDKPYSEAYNAAY